MGFVVLGYQVESVRFFAPMGTNNNTVSHATLQLNVLLIHSNNPKSMVTIETFDLSVSFYGNKHGTPRDVKLKHLCMQTPLFLLCMNNCIYLACRGYGGILLKCSHG